MFAAGEPVTMRSFKYHRPRGVFCLNGKCASCLVRIDGIPNQKACKVRCKDGMVVQRQSAMPNASNDILFANDYIFPNKLDYHHMFTSPDWLNKALNKVVRKLSGIGDLPDYAASETHHNSRYQVRCSGHRRRTGRNRRCHIRRHSQSRSHSHRRSAATGRAFAILSGDGGRRS